MKLKTKAQLLKSLGFRTTCEVWIYRLGRRIKYDPRKFRAGDDLVITNCK